MKYFIRLIIVALLLPGFAAVNAAEWKIDPDHTQIRFKVNHILTGVAGQFNAFSGTVFFDPADPGSGRFEFTVDVDSVDTNQSKRDSHLRSKDFFDTAQYPRMQFKSTRVSRLEGSNYRLKGLMTIKDVTKEIEIDFKFFDPKPHPFAKGKNVGGFSTKFSLQRLDYHVGDGKFLKMGVVGDVVDVEIDMEALADN